MRRHSLSGRSRSTSGFTLIEILVALALGVLILLALTILFSRNTGNHAELERTTRQLESARYSIDLLSEDLLHAGYFGEFNPNTLTNPPDYQTPDPCAAVPAAQGWNTAVVPVQIPVPVQGFAPGAAPGCLNNHRAGTEVLVVRHAETGAPTTVALSTASNLYIQIARCTLDTTRIQAAAGGSAAFNLRLPDCATVNTSLRRLAQRSYYIATCNDCVADDGIPTLKRVEWIDGVQRTMSVAEGVEDLQIEFGLDTAVPSDGVPDTFVAVGGVTGVAPNLWQNVVSVRVHLLTRSTQPTPRYTDTRTYQLGPGVVLAAPTDGFKRTLMTTTVRLDNVAGRSE